MAEALNFLQRAEKRAQFAEILAIGVEDAFETLKMDKNAIIISTKNERTHAYLYNFMRIENERSLALKKLVGDLVHCFAC